MKLTTNYNYKLLSSDGSLPPSLYWKPHEDCLYLRFPAAPSVMPSTLSMLSGMNSWSSAALTRTLSVKRESRQMRMPCFPSSMWSWRVFLHCLCIETPPSHSTSQGLAGKHCGHGFPPCPMVVPSLFQSGHSSPVSLFLGTLSQVQWPTAEATEGHDGKPRREGRWQGGQQSCLLSRYDIPDVFCLEERASPDLGGRWGKRCSLPPLPAASLKMDKWCDVTWV